MEKERMTVREAGRKGGLATKKAHGRDFFVKIGGKGGRQTRRLVEVGKRVLVNNKD